MSVRYACIPVLAAAILSIRGVSARLLVASSNIREKTNDGTGFIKVEGEECVKLQNEISNERFIGNTYNYGCEGTLVCLEDESSSTGARCVDVLTERKSKFFCVGYCEDNGNTYMCCRDCCHFRPEVDSCYDNCMNSM